MGLYHKYKDSVHIPMYRVGEHKKLFDKAVQLYESKRYRECEDTLAAILPICNDAVAYYYAAKCYIACPEMASEHKDVAVDCLKAAISAKYWPALDEMAYIYDEGLFVPQDYAQAMEWWYKSAEKGSARALCEIGRHYRLGLGVDKNLAEALSWFQKAAALEYPEAEYNLGEFYTNGTVVEKNAETAFSWFLRSAGHGHAVAQTSTGRCYCKGLGVEPDFSAGYEWYEKAILQGETHAMVNMANHLRIGKHIPQNLARAGELYKQAAEMGHSSGCFRYADMLSEGVHFPQNRSLALAWYKKALELGPPKKKLGDIEYGMAVCYSAYKDLSIFNIYLAEKYLNLAFEHGVTKDKHSIRMICDQCHELAGERYDEALASMDAKKYDDACDNFRKAGFFGNPDGYEKAGVMLWEGELVAQDIQKAIDYFSALAVGGYSVGHLYLGDIYRDGCDWVIADPEKALSHYEQAGELGNTTAIYRIFDHMAATPESVTIDSMLYWEGKLLELGETDEKAKAAFWFANYYEKVDESENRAEMAKKYYLLSARYGYAEAMTALAERYSADREEKAKWLMQASFAGDTDADVARWRLLKDSDSSSDRVQASLSLASAAQKGHPLAMHYIGTDLLEDEPEAALYWLRKNHDFPPSCLSLHKYYQSINDTINSNFWFYRSGVCLGAELEDSLNAISYFKQHPEIPDATEFCAKIGLHLCFSEDSGGEYAIDAAENFAEHWNDEHYGEYCKAFVWVAVNYSAEINQFDPRIENLLRSLGGEEADSILKSYYYKLLPQDNVEAFFRLGMFIWDKKETKDYAVKAEYYLKKAARRDHAEAQYNLAVLMLTEERVPLQAETDRLFDSLQKSIDDEPSVNLVNPYTEKLTKYRDNKDKIIREVRDRFHYHDVVDSSDFKKDWDTAHLVGLLGYVEHLSAKEAEFEKNREMLTMQQQQINSYRHSQERELALFRLHHFSDYDAVSWLEKAVHNEYPPAIGYLGRLCYEYENVAIKAKNTKGKVRKVAVEFLKVAAERGDEASIEYLKQHRLA